MIALAFQVLPVNAPDDRGFLGHDFARKFDDLSVLNFDSHLVAIPRGVRHVSLIEAIFESLLQGSKAAAIVDARRKPGHLPEHVRSIVLAGIILERIIHGNGWFQSRDL